MNGTAHGADRYERLASRLPMRDPQTGAEQLQALSPRALVGTLQGGPRYGDALLDAPEAAWTEYIGYIANERPAFQVGGEGRIAKRRLSRGAYRIYEAMGRSNMLELAREHVRAFLEEDRGEEAAQVRHLLARMERAQGARRPHDGPPGTSPLD